MNWLQTIIAQSLNKEVFIDSDGTVYSADGDVGPNNHDTTVLETVLSSSLDGFDELESLDPMDLNEEQWQRIDANYPGFIEYIAGGGLPKEYAVLKMGWIRVLQNTFEMGQVSEVALNHAADYAHEATDGNPGVTLYISDRSTNKMVPITLGELDEALQMGQAASKIYMLGRRPQGLY